MNHTTIKFALIGYILLSINNLGFAENARVHDVLDSKINAIAGFNDTIFAGTPKGLFVSFNNGVQWNLVDFSGKKVTALEFDGENLYTAVEYAIYRSTDKGKTWNKIETSQSLQPCIYVLSLLKHQDKLFVGLDDCNPFFLTDNDTAMTVITYNDEYVTGFQFLSKDSLVFIASGDNIFRSSDNGVTFQKTTPASLVDSNVTFQYMTKSDNAIFISSGKGVLRSSDNGSSWIDCTPFDLSDTDIRYYNPLAISGNVLLAGIYPHGIIRSTDNGNSWLKADSGLSGNVTVISVTGTTVFAGTSNNGIFRSSDSGKTWHSINNGLITIKATSVKKCSISNGFALKTFNHLTTVSIKLAQSQRIEADILDLSGRRIANLAHAHLPQGSHQLVWNYNREKAGCYILRLRIGETVYTNNILKLQ